MLWDGMVVKKKKKKKSREIHVREGGREGGDSYLESELGAGFGRKGKGV